MIGVLAIGSPVDNAWVVARLEEAGTTLLALPRDPSTIRLLQGDLEWVGAAAVNAGAVAVRMPRPSAARISEMVRIYHWLVDMPQENRVLPRILGSRSLLHPLTSRPLYGWSRLARAVGVRPGDVQRWHGEGVSLIVTMLNGAQRSAA